MLGKQIKGLDDQLENQLGQSLRYQVWTGFLNLANQPVVNKIDHQLGRSLRGMLWNRFWYPFRRSHYVQEVSC